MNRFSIIVPVYNAESCIENCVNSLVNQTYKNLEIILVNDGSTDNSGILCDEWAQKDSRVKVIHKPNGGVSSARNAGLDAAKGEYIVFANAYSILEPSAIEKCMAEISTHTPDLLVCAIKAPADDNRDNVYMDCNMYTRYEYIENIGRYISTGLGFDAVTNKIFSAHIIHSRSMRFSEDMPMVADELFNCRYFAAAGHIRCIADMLCTNYKSDFISKGTTEYLAQGKAFSQKLIDAVQSKGLYNVASRAIGENYQKILYRHLVLLCTQSNTYSIQQRTEAMAQLSRSADNAPLTMYLAELPGIKNKSAYQMYKLGQWKMLISILGR